jgi:hypothetical protein
MSALYAKDISFKIQNDCDFPITVFYGAISSSDNVWNDDEIVQKRVELKIMSVGRALAPSKKTQFNKSDLSGNSIVVLFGLINGGGRTAVYRYRVKDLGEVLDIAFEKIKVYKSNSSYINIAEGLKKTNNLGSYFLNTKNVIPGHFVFYNISAETQTEVFIADRIEEVEIKTSEKQNNTVSDLVVKTTVQPFMHPKGTLVRAVPPNDSVAYTEVTIPGLEKSAEIFADGTNKFLTWKVVGSGSVYVNYKDNNYFKLYSTSNVNDRAVIMNRFMKDVNETGSSPFHLYFITYVHRSDSLLLIDNGMRKLQDYELFEENDLITPNGNYRLDGNDKNIVAAANVINEVRGIDITPLLCYRTIVQDEFPATLTGAQNCIEIYKYLGGFIELPDLDDKTLSITNPTYTISRIKEVLSNPQILTSIETKIINLASTTLSISAMKIAQLKLNAR